MGKRVKKGDIDYAYDSNGNLVKQSNGMSFLYDNGGVFAFEYNNATYFYRKNAQNDIIAILDTNGDIVVKYVYDAWGNHKVLDASGAEISDATNIGILNPFRYRSYFYDNETGLYYLNARYYDPQTGRFISPDDISYLDPDTVNGLNLYAYCGDNPVMGYDPNGNWDWKKALKLVAAVAVVLAATAATVATAGLAACALGASAAVTTAVVTGATVGGVVAGGLEIGAQIIENGIEGMDLVSVGIESFSGAIYGGIAGLAGTTTSSLTRFGTRVAKVALSGFSTTAHGINSGLSAGKIMHNAGTSMLWSSLIQTSFIATDRYTGKLSSSVLESLKLDGLLSFGKKQLSVMFGMLVGKNAWRNRDIFI